MAATTARAGAQGAEGAKAELQRAPRREMLDDVAKEARFLLRQALPMMLRYYFITCAAKLGFAFVGHDDISADEIAGTLLGRMYTVITGMCVGVGIALAVAKFASENHGRGEDFRNGEVLRQCVKALALTYVFSATAAVVSWPLLGALGQPHSLLRPCWLTAMVGALGLPPVWLCYALGNVLISQGLVGPNVVCDCLASLVQFALMGIFVRVCGMGYIGAAWAMVVSQWAQLLLYIVYVVAWHRQGTVWNVQPKAADDGRSEAISLRAYLKVAVPSAVALVAEWGAAEVNAVFAGWLPSSELAVGANGLLFTTLSIVYVTFISVQVATVTRVGNLVGARDARSIPVAIATALVFGGALAAAIAALLYTCGGDILRFYTNQAGIVGVAVPANLGIALSVPPYALTQVLLGALRGAGLQNWGALSLCVSYYLVGLPLGALMALGCDVGLLGLWLGNAIALILAASIMGARLACVRWAAIVSAAPLVDGKASRGEAGSESTSAEESEGNNASEGDSDV